MQGRFQQIISTGCCEQSHLTGLPDKHNKLRAGLCPPAVLLLYAISFPRPAPTVPTFNKKLNA